jgi:hypothetical protein
VLALAFVARFAVGLANDGVLYPDETMQYLEQAHRLVFGAGMVPWEYDYGVRPWVVPLALAVPMRILALAGLDSPAVYQPVIKALLCVVSLVVPFAAFRVARAVAGEHAGRLALVLTAFWYELVSYGHRATIDAIVAYVAFGALALAFGTPTIATRLGCGGLIGLAFVLRFQMTPALAMIAVVAIVRWRERAATVALACAVTVVAGGALDYYAWGLWFSAIRTSIELNAIGDVSSLFGVYPFYWYGVVLVVLSGGLVLAGAAGLASSWRSSWPLIAVAVATLAGFSWIGHKETRFIFIVTPIWLIGLAALTAGRRPLAATGLVAAFTIVSVLGLFDRLPLERRYLRPNIARNVAREAYRALAAHDDVVAVLDASGWSGWYLTPYYDLHHDVPLYWPLSRGYEEAMARPTRYVSHVIAPGGSTPRGGFRELERVGSLVIWRRIVDPPFTNEVLGYERRIHALQPVKIPPRVMPRW